MFGGPTELVPLHAHDTALQQPYKKDLEVSIGVVPRNHQILFIYLSIYLSI